MAPNTKPEQTLRKDSKGKILTSHGNILDTVFTSGASPAWGGVEFDLELLKEGIIQRIRNGEKTQFGRDQWIP
jgi:hypothetical protein